LALFTTASCCLVVLTVAVFSVNHFDPLVYWLVGHSAMV
jgi:hypothetical protein